MRAVRFFALVALVAFAVVPHAAAGAATPYIGAGGSAAAQFFPDPSAMCRYTSALHIDRLVVAVDGHSVTSAQLAASMTETNESCDDPPLGRRPERYHLKDAHFDGHRLHLDFTSSESNAAKNDVSYSGTLSGATIVGVAEFHRYDSSPACNWTIRVEQNLTLRST